MSANDDRFRRLAESIGDVFWAFSADLGQTHYISPGYEAIWGRTVESLYANPHEWIGAVVPMDRDRFSASLSGLSADEPNVSVEFRISRPDTAIRWIRSQVFLTRDESGTSLITGIATDITEQRRTEQKLRESERRFQDMLPNVDLLGSAVHHSKESILITDAELDAPGPRILFVNPAFTTMTGYTAEEVVGKTPRLLQGPKTDRAVVQRLRQDLSLGNTFHGETINYRKDGAEFHLEWQVAPIRDAQGIVSHYVAIQRDVSERKRIESELLAARDTAMAALEVKSQFLANMSHEIRTPMSAVIGLTDLLYDTSLDREQKELVETIAHSGELLLSIINEVLDLSKLDAGKMKLEDVDFNVQQVVEDALDMLAEKAHNRGLDIMGLVKQEVFSQLSGDPFRLRQILTNLLDNAVKFTEKGEVVLLVSQQSESNGKVTLLFEVSDSGVGIPAETLHQIFEAFTQADSSTTRKYGGTGLGLTIARQLVTMMGGEIGVRSDPGIGSTFWFTARFEKQSAPATPEDRSKLRGLRVLVAVESTVSRQILQTKLANLGMLSEGVADGGAALQLLKKAAREENSYDLAILGLHLPSMDGLTLARAIKADPKIACTRLVALSSLGNPLNARELFGYGFAEYLVKPIRQVKLYQRLAAVVEGSMGGSSTDVLPVPDPALKQPRILLAEDNPIKQKVALAQLKKLGYKADAVPDGLAAIAALRKQPYDIILMDCQMPGMDGYETAKRLRLEYAAPLYIIALTAHAMESDRAKCLRAGMDDYVTKPIRPAELKAAIEQWESELSIP